MLWQKDIGTDIRNRNLAYDMIQFETPQLDAFLVGCTPIESEDFNAILVYST